MIKCPHCGGELTYLPGTEIVKCDYCGSEFSPEEIENYREVDAAEYQEKSWQEDTTIEATVFTCPQCGGEIYSLDQSAVTFCSYCGSQVTLMSRLTKIRRPDHVIPFKLTAEQGIEEYYKRVRKALFVPSAMKKDSEVEKLRGIYMPYWIYDVKAPEVLSVKSSVEHTQGNYVVKDHYSTEIRAEGGVDGIAFDAASAFSDEMSDAIGPYDFREAKDYHPGYLSSYYADEGDVDSSLYEEDAIRIAGEKYAETVYHPDMKKYGLEKNEIADAFVTDDVDKKLGYYPVWFLANRNRKGNRVSYATVNGQTGKAAVDLPVDFRKYLIGSLIIAIPIFVLLTMFLTMTPRVLGIVVMVLSIVAVIFANFKLNAVYARKGMFDDLGLSSKDPAAQQRVQEQIRNKRKQKTTTRSKTSIGGTIGSSFFMAPFILGSVYMLTRMEGVAILIFLVFFVFRIVYAIVRNAKPKATVKSSVSAPFKDKILTMWKCLAAFVICLAVMLIDPVSDMIYYAADIVAILLTGWTVLDIVRAHNELTTRKLPQFGKRGGDEHEY